MKVNVLIDLGNSETRVILLAGGQRKMYGLANKFALLPSGYKVSPEYINNDSCVFESDNNYWAVGALADREFVGQLTRPSAMMPKCKQDATKLTLNYIFISVLTNLASMMKQPIAELEPEFDVAVLVPPAEHDSHLDEMKEFIASVKKVHQVMPADFSVDMKYTSIKVFPESFAAFFAAYYDTSAGILSVREGNQRFGEGIVLCLDIGSGTSDLCLINQSSLVLGSKASFPIGGNTVEAHLRKELSKAYGFTPKDITSVALTGVLQDGDIEHDVSALVKDAKEVYTKTFRSNLLPYLEGLGMSLREVRGILVVGGGSLPTVHNGVEVAPSLSAVIVEYLKKNSPNIALMEVPEDMNPRYLNILGLETICKFSN